MNEQSEPVLSLTVPAKPEYLIVCRLALNGLVELAGMGDEAISDLKLAVTEACANSISHAYAGGEGSVTVRLTLRSDNILVEVLDEGVGLARTADVPTLQDDEDREGGMGLALIRALADDVDVGESPSGRGTRIAFSKAVA